MRSQLLRPLPALDILKSTNYQYITYLIYNYPISTAIYAWSSTRCIKNRVLGSYKSHTQPIARHLHKYRHRYKYHVPYTCCLIYDLEFYFYMRHLCSQQPDSFSNVFCLRMNWTRLVERGKGCLTVSLNSL